MLNLEPKILFDYFHQICQIPRPSKKEEKIIQYLIEFGKKHNIETQKDSIGNVIMRKPATKGYEDLTPVVLQSHVDMVCEKNEGTEHDFDKDPISTYVDGEWVKAKGTTLGADNGIGVAAQLAVLASEDIAHGPIECLFTVDEETGLTGAFHLEPNILKGEILLNLDSEDDGEAFIGCAGGIDTVARFPLKTTTVDETKYFPIKIEVTGLLGGHSGDDIDKGRGNAIKLLGRFLWEINQKYDIEIVSFKGGNLRNAIAREAEAIVLCNNEFKEDIRAAFNVYSVEQEKLWKKTEPKIHFELGSTKMNTTVWDKELKNTLLHTIYACPYGVFSMSQSIEGMVETSTNLAAIKQEDNEIIITTSQRSEVDSQKFNMAQMVSSVFHLAGADVKHSDGYPGWTPNPDSPIMEVAVESYKRLFGKDLVVRSIHAGLECGLFLEKYPHWDMISIGPDIKGAHSPDERLHIESTQKFWKHLLDMLVHLPKDK
ncbi:dipeptidase D [Balneicella halophila]|uniref:Cytosol non-specific dipeptidase n=1 Tax=Balneicella halophila TaxID=1537566 RepID=A0A7L4UMT7_BALHA|nr:aminoacyl-histidine dipeptidase [Balneicella halophila]PVX49936.1 dipeptidase D [Balneicella halophila]